MGNLTCVLCGFVASNLVSHIKHKHNMKPSLYKTMYNVKSLIVYTPTQLKHMSDVQLKRYKDDPSLRSELSKNQKNGASVWTRLYWTKRGYSDEEAKQKISALQKENSTKSHEKWKPEYSSFTEEFWCKRGHSGSSAKEQVRKIQSELSSRSSRYTGKSSTPERNAKISISVKKHIESVGKINWLDHFGIENGTSKTERLFFAEIYDKTGKDVYANVNVGDYIVDVICEDKIIEFYGDFWHANPEQYKPDTKVNLPGTPQFAEDIWDRDSKRIACLEKMGYHVMIVWESDWHKNKSRCLELITELLYK
jgi:very-short-patch-repair endonuclease